MNKFGLAPILFAFIVAGAASAEDEKPYAVPIEWQRVELQRQVEDSLVKSIQTVIDRNKFHVHVDIRLTGPRTFESSAATQQNSGGKDFPLAKLGLNKDSAAYRKAISESGDNVFTRIGGLSVNLILDSTVPQSAERQAREFVSEVVKSYTSANVDLKSKRLSFYSAPPQNTAEVEAAKASLEAAKTLADAILKSNGKIAEAINLVQSREPAADAAKPNEPAQQNSTVTQMAPQKDFPKNWKQGLMEFQIPLGILFATILFMLSIGGFKKIESQKVAVMAAGNQAKASGEAGGGEERAAEKSQESAASGATVAMAGGPAGSESVFEQFRKIAENHSEAASYLVKSWINMDSEAAREAIAVLTKAIPLESLVPVVQTMDEDLKSRFKRASLTSLDAAAMARAEGFIVEQMVENFLVNTIDLPDEVKSLMSSMSIQEAVECVKKDKKLGGIFVNVLQTAQVVKLLKSLSDADVTSVFQEGVKYSSDSIDYLGSTLNGLLEQIRGGKKTTVNPLIQRSVELISSVGAEREGQILQMLLSSGAKDQAVEASFKFYPAEILLTFPPDKLRVLMSRLSAKQRANLIYTRNDNHKKTLLAAIGEQGRVREMINEELREIEKNETLKAQLKKNQTKIWQDFVDAARDTIRTDSRVKDVAEDLLKKWLVSKGVDANRIAAAQAA